MKPVDIDESVSTVYSDDENYDEDSFEASLEILYGAECDADANSKQEKTIETITLPNDEDTIGIDIIHTFNGVPNEDMINCNHLDDEETEIKFQSTVQTLAEEFNQATRIIEEEKEQIEKELQGYKDLREMFDKISKEFDRSVGFKPKSLASHQDPDKQCRQAESVHHVMSTAPVKSNTKFSLPTLNPWFYSKCLQDAEKFCDQQMERVRRCISVSSMNSPSLDMGTHKLSRCAGEPSLDAQNEIMGDSMARCGEANQKRNLSFCSWRQQLPNPKYLDKKLMGCMERGDGGNEDTNSCSWLSAGSNIISQINSSGNPCAY